VYPLSFREFLSFKGLEIKNEFEYISNKLEIERYFDEFLEFGGFSKVALIEDEELKKAELKSYFDSVYL